MDLRTLSYLVEIVEQGSFAKAASKIPISQPALSKAIAQVEQQFSLSLLERGRKGVNIHLTPAGQAVYQFAKRQLQDYQQLREELATLNALQSGQLNIGLPPVGSTELFAPLLALFHQRYPHIRLSLLEQGSITLQQALRAHEIELAVSLLPVADDFACLPLASQPMVALLPLGHPLSNQLQLTFADLQATPVIMLESGFLLRERILQASQQAKVTLSIITSSRQIDFAIALVAAGSGMMLLPELIAKKYQSSGVALVAFSDPHLDWIPAFIWRKNSALSMAAQAWLQLVNEIN